MRALEMFPFIIIMIGMLVSIFLLRNEQKPCSSAQLHEVIEKVDVCKKNSDCSNSEIDRLTKEVCR